MSDPKMKKLVVWLLTPLGASSVLIAVSKFLRFIMVDTYVARLMVSEYRRNHLHLLTARSSIHYSDAHLAACLLGGD